MWENIKFASFLVLVVVGMVTMAIEFADVTRAGREHPSLKDRVCALERRVEVTERNLEELKRRVSEMEKGD